MTAVITKNGNNLGLQFPQNILKYMPISENDNMRVWVRNNVIMLTKEQNNRHRSTKDRIIEFLNTSDKMQHRASEFDWGKLQGEEVW